MGILKKIAAKLQGGPAVPPAPAAGTSNILNALQGKKVTFQGRFSRLNKYRLKRMEIVAEAQQAKIVQDVTGDVNYVVVVDLGEGKAAQAKAVALNAKGAGIQVIDADAFEKLITPTMDQVVRMIRGAKDNAPLLSKATGGTASHFVMNRGPTYTISSENFDALDLSGFDFRSIDFQDCSFISADLSGTLFGSFVRCDLSKAKCEKHQFPNVRGSRFHSASLKGAQFQGSIEGADFKSADLEAARFWARPNRGNTSTSTTGMTANFENACLKGATFSSLSLNRPSFRGANLQNASFPGTIALIEADFKGADLRGVDFGDCDLTGSCFDGADLADANLSGAKLDNVDLSKAKNFNPSANPIGSIGPALAEFDQIAAQAKRVRFQIKYQQSAGGGDETAGVDTAGLKYGWAVRLPRMSIGFTRRPSQTASGALLYLASKISRFKIRYETLEVKSVKSPKTGKDLRELVMNALAEATLQPVPPADQLAAARQAYRGLAAAGSAELKAQRQAARKQREETKKREETLRKRELQKIEKNIEKKVGKITDIATFLKALELRVDKQKIDKATKMLKAERFKLFNDVTDQYLSGVVKSQTDPDLIYACRIHKDGGYACCTQNMNICGGLRGSVCKHLLVLIVGLVQAGQLDPGVIDAWISKTHSAKPVLDKEIMGEIFLKYKGAEAGEIDWRPTETLPEDFYAV